MSRAIFSPIDLTVAIGRRAKERRLGLGVRQVDLAVQAGVPLSTLKRFENTGQGSLETIARIAFALRAEDGLSELFPPHDARTLDDVLAANRSRQRARR